MLSCSMYSSEQNSTNRTKIKNKKRPLQNWKVSWRTVNIMPSGYTCYIQEPEVERTSTSLTFIWDDAIDDGIIVRSFLWFHSNTQHARFQRLSLSLSLSYLSHYPSRCHGDSVVVNEPRDRDNKSPRIVVDLCGPPWAGPRHWAGGCACVGLAVIGDTVHVQSRISRTTVTGVQRALMPIFISPSTRPRE
jgi:hypothetical protein